MGLNHLTWERGVRLLDADGRPGRDLLPGLLEEHGPAVAAHLDLPLDLLRHLGVVPSYYLRYFYAHDAVVAEQRTSPTRASQVAALEEKLLAMYADPALVEKPSLLQERGGAFYSEAAVALVASLMRDRGDVQVVNVRNDGVLPFLPDDAVVEVPATIGSTGASPLPIAPVEPLYAGLIAHTFAYEQLALDAAVNGGRERVFDALLAHPLVGQIDLANDLTDRLIANNREHLSWA